MRVEKVGLAMETRRRAYLRITYNSYQGSDRSDSELGDRSLW